MRCNVAWYYDTFRFPLSFISFVVQKYFLAITQLETFQDAYEVILTMNWVSVLSIDLFILKNFQHIRSLYLFQIISIFEDLQKGTILKAEI